MKASFLFNNILGTIADNLGALIEFTLIYKTKVLRPSSDVVLLPCRT